MTFVASVSVVFSHRVRYWQLDVSKIPTPNNREVWDRSVYEASEEYKGRMVSYSIVKCLYIVCV